MAAVVGLVVLVYSLSRLRKSWSTYRHHLKITYGGSLATYTVLVDFLIWLAGVLLGIGLLSFSIYRFFATLH